MIERKENYNISREVFKFPWNGNFEPNYNEMFSEKFCCYTINVRKKVRKRIKWAIFYVQVGFPLANGVVPSQVIGLPILPPTSSIMRSIHYDTPKKVIIARVINNSIEKILFTEKQMDEFYDLAVKYRNNSMSREEVILELSGGAIENWVAAVGIILTILTMMNNLNTGEGFSVPPGAIVPPHLQWLYGNQQPGNHFGYGKGAGPRSLTVTGLTQNAGSEKKEPSSCSYNYLEIMSELKRQSNKTTAKIKIVDQIYTIKYNKGDNVYILGNKLAEQLYDRIRESDTDVCDIASNLGFKANNIKNVKDHIFYNEHDLDRYVLEEIEHKRFDASLQQALAWKRLEAGTHKQDDVTWIKHECAERHHELKYGSGYSEAHERAQNGFDGFPWKEDF
jgi:hypothetical protein